MNSFWRHSMIENMLNPGWLAEWNGIPKAHYLLQNLKKSN